MDESNERHTSGLPTNSGTHVEGAASGSPGGATRSMSKSLAVTPQHTSIDCDAAYDAVAKAFPNIMKRLAER